MTVTKQLTFLVLFVFTFSIFVTKQAEASSLNYREIAIKKGQAVMGTKYKWGGATPKGFDCSGLMYYSFNKAGKKIPRTTGELFKKGQTVQKKSLKRGDLIFFSTYKKGASHVGIYLGEGKFLHSSSSKGVSVAKLSNSYWAPKYHGAKRF